MFFLVYANPQPLPPSISSFIFTKFKHMVVLYSLPQRKYVAWRKAEKPLLHVDFMLIKEIILDASNNKKESEEISSGERVLTD